MQTPWVPNELALAGAEHRDPAFVADYDAKAGLDVAPDLQVLLDLGPGSTLVDIGAGTGLLAAAAATFFRRVIAVDPSPVMLTVARGRGVDIECVRGGFLTYEHEGEAPDAVYSRNALHHLPDAWKTVALRRVADLLAPGGVLVLRDIVYSCGAEALDDVLQTWFAAAPIDRGDGWTRAELETHVREEHSTFSWLLEPMLRRAGLEIRDAWRSESRTFARYVCRKPPDK